MEKRLVVGGMLPTCSLCCELGITVGVGTCLTIACVGICIYIFQQSLPVAFFARDHRSSWHASLIPSFPASVSLQNERIVVHRPIVQRHNQFRERKRMVGESLLGMQGSAQLRLSYILKQNKKQTNKQINKQNKKPSFK